MAPVPDVETESITEIMADGTPGTTNAVTVRVPRNGGLHAFLAERAAKRRHVFEWTDDCFVDLIRFVGYFYEKHHQMADAHDRLSLEKAYVAVYEEIRTTYPKLASVRLDGMLTEYCQLLKAWVKIQKDFNSSTVDIQRDVRTRVESRGMDSTIFFLLKEGIEECREVKITPILRLLGRSPPLKGLAKAIFFLLDATRAEFDAHEAVVAINRLHVDQKLRSRKAQEEIRYEQLCKEIEARHRGIMAELEEEIENVAGEILEADQGQSANHQNLRDISERLYAPDHVEYFVV